MEEGSINDGFDHEDYYNDAAATQMRPTSKTAIEGLEKVNIDENFGKLGFVWCAWSRF